MRPTAQVEHILPADFVPFGKDEVEGSVVERFSKIVMRYSDRVAVEDCEREFTYGELDTTANIVANCILSELDTNRPEPIPLLYKSAAASYAAQLAVLKSGKFFASLDSGLARPKLLTILRDLGARLLLTDAEAYPLALRLANEVPGLRVLNSTSLGLSSDKSTIEPRLDGSDVAYIVYTSGSTGDPRGVVILHRNVLHSTMNHTNHMHLRHVDRASQLCAVGSAASASETYAMLLNGGTLLPYSVKGASQRLGDWLRIKRVTLYCSVPTTFRLLLDAAEEGERFPDVRLVRLSGDRVLRSDVERFKKHFGSDCLLRVSLGAAECFLYSQLYIHSAYTVDRQVVPAGYPLDDMEVLVVDEELKRLGVGIEGEIAVKSKYLSAGYWKDEALTKARFIDIEDEPGVRMYLTRDVGYQENDGCLVHVGRKDFNVKIYGKMVSIGEVEEAALKIPDVKEAVVVPTRNEFSETRLKLYYVATESASLGSRSIREHLLNRLSAEMVPETFVQLEQMPLTRNQKIDRKRLARL